jgi:MFS family permease
MVEYSEPRGVKFILRALRSRNYRLFFAGNGISIIGTWMQRIALGWLVYRLTDSALMLGIVSFSNLIPSLLLTPIAGVWADRVNRRYILVVTQSLAMLQAFAMAALFFTKVIDVYQIIALSLFAGVYSAFDAPTRQSFVVEMVGRKEDLSNAIALNSSLFNGARLIGPSLAGLIILISNEGVCFLVNGVTYVAVIAALLAMSTTASRYESRKKQVLKELREGFDYAARSMPIRTVLLMLCVMSFFGMSYTVVMPVIARDVLGGQSDTLGFLMGAGGVGALAGAYYLASRRTVVGLERVIALASGVFGVGLVAFSLSRTLALSLVFMAIVGSGMMVQMASINTFLQSVVEDDKRGRVMGLYTAAFFGVGPFGSLTAGATAHWLGAPRTLLLYGVISVVSGILFFLITPKIRAEVSPVYLRNGFLTGKETAAIR